MGERIKKVLKARGVTAYKIQRDLRMSEGTIRGWISGKTPQSDLLFKVADYLNVDPKYLMGISQETTDEMTIIANRITQTLLKKSGSLERLKNFEEMVNLMPGPSESEGDRVRSAVSEKRKVTRKKTQNEKLSGKVQSAG